MNDLSSEDVDENDSDDYESEDFDSDGNLLLSDDSDDPAPSDEDNNDNDSIPSGEATPLPEDSDELLAAASELDALCSLATTELSHLPRRTRNTFTSQTRSIFQSYSKHGSQLRLANALEKFLLAPADDNLNFTPQSPPLLPKPEPVTRSHDPDSGYLIRDTPFHAVDLSLEISGDVTIPAYLLPSLDRIFGLYTLEARALLKHHCEKYGDEPIFRAGIREYMQSQVEGILDSTAEDPLGLTPENRSFLLQVYEKTPTLNVAEKRLLAMSTRLSLETVEMFWGDMDLKRGAYVGMRKLVAARELETMRAEKRDAVLKRQRDMMLEAGREFGWRDEGAMGVGG